MAPTNTLLQSLLSQPESDILEFTVQAEPILIARTVVAFLNTQGGTIVVGASEQNGWIGIENAEHIREEIDQFLAANIAPEPDLRIERVEDAGREGLIIEVPPGGTKPYVFQGAIYVRTGAQQIRSASPADITRLVAQRLRDEERWERKTALGIEPGVLDRSQIDLTVAMADQRHNLSFESHATLETKLERLDLLVDGWPRNAAVALFLGEKERRRYPQLAAHTTVLRGEDRLEFMDDKVFEGNAFDLFDRLTEFVERHTSIRSNIGLSESVRVDRPTIPALVLREAILNAIAHRDYQETSPVQLRLFPDRLELWNPGSIPQELIEQPGVSRPRNPDIARILYLRGLVEMRGVGMVRMRDGMASLGLPAPRWENRSGGTQVTLPFTVAAAIQAGKSMAEAEARALSERAFAYLLNTKKGDRITRTAYQERYARDVAERSARNDLKRLVDFGYLRQVGAASKTAYIRTEKTAPTL